MHPIAQAGLSLGFYAYSIAFAIVLPSSLQVLVKKPALILKIK